MPTATSSPAPVLPERLIVSPDAILAGERVLLNYAPSIADGTAHRGTVVLEVFAAMWREINRSETYAQPR